MFFWCFSVTLFYVYVNVLSNPVIPCKLNDAKCFEKFLPTLYEMLIQGDPKLGTENLDPMHHDVIEGNLSVLKYKLTNSTVEGHKDCKIENIKLDPGNIGLHADMICPSLKMYGTYSINGRLVALPVEGTGEYSIITKTYRITIDLEWKIEHGNDGKNYIAVKNFRVKPEPLEPIVFDFKNLFNGQKDLAVAVHKFANENWKDVSNDTQDPVFEANFKKLIESANKLFKTIPIEDLFKN